MQFIFGLVTFILASALIAVCLFAIPGPDALEGEEAPHDHGHGH